MPQHSISGPQVKNYTVTITNLVKEFNVNTNSVKEAAPDIKRAVLGALIDAVNDSQVGN